MSAGVVLEDGEALPVQRLTTALVLPWTAGAGRLVTRNSRSQHHGRVSRTHRLNTPVCTATAPDEFRLYIHEVSSAHPNAIDAVEAAFSVGDEGALKGA